MKSKVESKIPFPLFTISLPFFSSPPVSSSRRRLRNVSVKQEVTTTLVPVHPSTSLDSDSRKDLKKGTVLVVTHDLEIS